MQELVTKINKILKKPVIPSDIILSKFKILDIKKPYDYDNPIYYPFYFYLGREVKPKNVLEIGTSLGLISGCFFTSCKSTENFLTFQTYEDGNLAYKIAVKNIKRKYKKGFKFYMGDFYDEDFQTLLKEHKWDLILFNEEMNYDKYMSKLEILWQNLSLDGLLILDRVNSDKSSKQAYKDFCQIKNRENLIFKSKYGSGLIVR